MDNGVGYGVWVYGWGDLIPIPSSDDENYIIRYGITVL
jgi:hypothetical protein